VSSNRTRRPIRLPRAERREQLLDVTKQIVGAVGMHGVSIDRVAREAGITRPIVYEHFEDLGGLLRALLQRESGRAMQQLIAAMPEPDVAASKPAEVIDILMAALTGYLEAVVSDPVTWRLVLMPPEGVPEFMREGTAQGRAAIVAQLQAIIDHAYEPFGGQSSPDSELTATTMAAIAEHWARLLLTAPERYDLERVISHARWAINRFAPQLRAP
jgi:AcrR family transcriptional regulator